MVEAQASLQVTVFHLQQLVLIDPGAVSTVRLTSALTCVVQQMGMSSLFFMSTTSEEVSSPGDWSAFRSL